MIDLTIFEMESDFEVQIINCLNNHLNQFFHDFIVSGIGVRIYNDGKKYHGSFQNSKREGFDLFILKT